MGTTDSVKILPTKWPLFELHFSIWKLHIKTVLFTPENEINVYEYLMLVVIWNKKELLRFRLFDIYTRMIERAYKVDLDKMQPVKPVETPPMTISKQKISKVN